MGGALVAIRISSLDDVTPEERAAIPVTYGNGRDDKGWEPPAVTSCL